MKKKVLSTLLSVLIVFGWGWAQIEESIPDAPSHLRAFTRLDGAMGVTELSWHDESDNELSFRILRADNGKEFHEVALVGANTRKYDDKVGKYSIGGFVYKVCAFNQAGDSEDSNIVSVWY